MVPPLSCRNKNVISARKMEKLSVMASVRLKHPELTLLPGLKKKEGKMYLFVYQGNSHCFGNLLHRTAIQWEKIKLLRYDED